MGITALSSLQDISTRNHSQGTYADSFPGTQQYLLWPGYSPQPQASKSSHPVPSPMLTFLSCLTSQGTWAMYYLRQPPSLTESKNTKLGPICPPTDEHRCAVDFRGDWQTVKAVRNSTCCLHPSSPSALPPTPGASGTCQGNILKLTYKKLHLPSGWVGGLGSSWGPLT